MRVRKKLGEKSEFLGTFLTLLVLDRGSLTYPDTPIGEELTWAVFIAIWPHSCSPMTAEYLIALEDAS